MSVLTFSTSLPSYHPRKGESTYFVEKILKSLHSMGINIPSQIEGRYTDAFGIKFIPEENIHFHEPKHHTIRGLRKDGKKWKSGDKFSPRVWSGKPYYSKQIIIAPDIEVKKVWDFEIDKDGCFFINGELYAYTSSTELLDTLARNDGLTQSELFGWFKYPKPFKGQIICWNEGVEY